MKGGDFKIVFFGTPEFAKIVLERLIRSLYKPVLVVTQSDQPVGRRHILTPSPVKVLAEQHQIPVFQPKKLGSDFGFRISDFKPDLLIVAAYGNIIPKKILDIPKYGALNVHPSLLPRWRGPSPIQYTVLNGEKETGVTIMLIDEEVDHGDIVSSIRYRVAGIETADKLSQELAKIGADLLIETIPKWIAGKITPKEQDHSQATYSKILTKEDGRIDWSKSAKETEQQIRAFTPWPGSFTFWDKKRLGIISGYVSPTSLPRHPSPGRTFIDGNGKIAIQTGRGTFVIESLRLEGKGEVSSKAFLNGHPDMIGATLR